MDQQNGAGAQYERQQVRHGGYVIEAWARQDERGQGFHGLARFWQEGSGHPAQTLGEGAQQVLADAGQAVSRAIQEAKARIDSQSRQTPMPD
ncbi:hypothetical protein V8Z80_14465 [Orrella sp. JC864]|uniref:hypothetical protein n=1 Tax=Orrella sp. JC864 TaxID=3120298 RepID=UPI00300A071F